MKKWRIQICQVSKGYGEQVVLDHFSQELEGGGVYCLMAPSGGGKTTLLRLLAGLEKPEEGEIRFSAEKREEKKDFLSPGELPLGMVFQEDRLCPDLGAEKNILLARPILTGEKLKKVVKDFLQEEDEKKPVKDFSGGMRRRVALLRALLSPGEILLMDEPFNGLDEETRGKAYELVKEYRKDRTLLFTTHHEEEANAMGAEILTLSAGEAPER